MTILETTDVIKQYKVHDSVVNAVDRASMKVEDGEFVAAVILFGQVGL